VFKGVSGCIEDIRGIMGCSREFWGCFGGVPGCSEGVPGVFRGVQGVFWGCSGVFRGCSGGVKGFTDTRLDIRLLTNENSFNEETQKKGQETFKNMKCHSHRKHLFA